MTGKENDTGASNGQMKLMNTKEAANALENEIAKIIVGKSETIRLVLTSVFSGGHVLLEDLPGSGKTTLVKCLAAALGCDYKRIQFTPDLLPSDVAGLTVYDQKTQDFVTKLGPVNTNLLLADEINRAIPRTQAALLEAMEERQVTIDGTTYSLPDPFFVMATQNPVEKESTFPLPAAQMDRFFMKLSMGYPTREEEEKMLSLTGDGIPFDRIEKVVSPEELLHMREEIQAVTMRDSVKSYIVELVARTREDASLKQGASPRASRSLYQAGRTFAAMAGRDYVTPEDIQAVFEPVVTHRIELTGEARYSGMTAQEVLRKIMESVPVPPAKADLFKESGKT